MAGRTIGGLFTDQARRETALAELQRANFNSAQISEVADDHESVAPKKLTNPLTDFFTDHTTTGSEFRDNLTELGMSEDDARYFEDGVARGGALVTVKADEGASEAVAILQNNGADLGSQGRAPKTPPLTAGASPGSGKAPGASDVIGEQTLKLKAELLAIEKVRVASGDVRIRREVVSRQETIDVPVSHDELVIERRPVTDGTVGGTIGSGEKITVPLSRDEVKIDKRTVVTEEVEIGKRDVTETKHVSESVRHEELVVDGDVKGKPPVR